MPKGWVEVNDILDESEIDPELCNLVNEDLLWTWPGNALKQPGMVNVSPVRAQRSTAEVAKDKSDCAEKSKKDQVALEQKRKAVAEPKDAMAVDEEAREATAAKPVHGQ
ncbi:hypothetical protein BYT27DRAFT_7255243 [Phlegmacium glaucopus]|nr:hypothetical protein BYT27DRAFT_7255243 [Phlegmacium glaucopus]